MDHQLPNRVSSASIAPGPEASTGPARPTSPIKRTSVVDDSTFLTALAAQERRVLELREELQKAEEALFRLKKQWASNVVIKKKNEFRQREHLQTLKTASRTSTDLAPGPDIARPSFDVSNGPPRKSSDVDRRSSGDGEEKPSRQNNGRQPHRKVFAPSRHTKTLSLLSTIDTAQTWPDQAMQGPMEQTEQANQGGPSSLNRSRTLMVQPCIARTETDTNISVTGQPKELFIETGKQIVGDLREGLWTFFEDLRQATVGEEATSSPHRCSKAPLNDGNYTRAGKGRQGEGTLTPKRQSRNMEKERPGLRESAPDVPLVMLQASGQRPRKSPIADSKAGPKDVLRPLAEHTEDSVDEDWDDWGTPAAKGPGPNNSTESVTSDSLASASTGRNSPRSSMR